MRVQRVVMPVTGETSWTVVDDDFCPVEPAERYLAHLAALERSPNTVRAYAQGFPVVVRLPRRAAGPVGPRRTTLGRRPFRFVRNARTRENTLCR